VNVWKVYIVTEVQPRVSPTVGRLIVLLLYCYYYFITVSQDVGTWNIIKNVHILLLLLYCCVLRANHSCDKRVGAISLYAWCVGGIDSNLVWSMCVLSAVVLRTRVVQNIRCRYNGDNVTMEICTYGVFVYIIVPLLYNI